MGRGCVSFGGYGEVFGADGRRGEAKGRGFRVWTGSRPLLDVWTRLGWTELREAEAGPGHFFRGRLALGRDSIHPQLLSDLVSKNFAKYEQYHFRLYLTNIV